MKTKAEQMTSPAPPSSPFKQDALQGRVCLITGGGSGIGEFGVFLMTRNTESLTVSGIIVLLEA